MSCLLCGAATTFLFSVRDWQRPQDQTKYALYWCEKCDLGRLDGDFTPAQVATFYDLDYYTHRANFKRGTYPAPSFIQRLRTHLAWRVDQGCEFRPDELGPALGRTVCDIGCGKGSLLAALKTAGFLVVGVEPDPKARQISSQIADVFAGTAECIPPELNGCKFDFVIMSHVLEHCIDPRRAIDNVGLLLSPGGAAIIEVPNNAASGRMAFGIEGAWLDIPRHLSFFTTKSLTRLIQNAGLKPDILNYVGYTQQFSAEWLAAQNAMWNVMNTDQPPNFDLQLYWLFVRTAFVRKEAKYDCVRIKALRD